MKKKDTYNTCLVKFWGCRGTVPHYGADKKEYGTNTACVSIEYKDVVYVFDAGTGLLGLSKYLSDTNQADKDVHLFLSHYHYDHIEGLPFVSLLENDNFYVYGPESNGLLCEETLQKAFAPPYYPINAFNLSPENTTTLGLTGEVILNDIKIEYLSVNHPGGCLSYKVTVKDKQFCYLTDYEWIESTNDEVVEFIKEVDLLVIDAHFTEDNFIEGWGHTTWEKGQTLAKEANVKSCALYHHNPYHSDEKLNALQKGLCDNKEEVCFFVKEGRTIEL